MRTSEIYRFLERDTLLCNVKVLPRDKWTLDQGSVIINTDPAHLPGKHWLAIHVQEGQIYFFDSSGHSPEYYGFHFPKDYDVISNTKRWQSIGTEYCGHYCLFFLWHVTRGWTIQALMDKYWSRITQENDEIIMDFFQDMFLPVPCLNCCC